MKAPHILLSLFPLTLLFSSCTQTAGKVALPSGLIAFNLPMGDPYGGTRDWNKYGPGAVIRKKDQTPYLPAKLLVGNENVTACADKTNWTPCSMPKEETTKQSIFNAAATYTFNKLLSAGLDAKYLNTLKFNSEFGNTFHSNIAEGELKNLISKADARNAITSDSELVDLLRQDGAHVVMGLLVTDSLKVTVTDSNENKVDLTATMTPEQKASLGLDNTTTSSKDLSFSQPRFFAYYHLSVEQLRDLKIVE